MSQTIKLDLHSKTTKEVYSCSKFFGAPVLTKRVYSLIEHSVSYYMFFFQLKLSDIPSFDEKTNFLPKKGYLYGFLDMDEYPYKLKCIYDTDEDPHLMIEGFNKEFLSLHLGDVTSAIYIDYKISDDTPSGTKLFGEPGSQYLDLGKRKVFMQFDPLEDNNDVFTSIDGLIFITYDPLHPSIDDLELVIDE